ncbi:MAG: hypothetical protein R2681_03120 [Pyrinomonadaceae bacterium]
MNKHIKQLFFVAILVFGCSVVGFAQSDPPPKPKPPVIEPKPKPTPKPKPKPEAASMLSVNFRAIIE